MIAGRCHVCARRGSVIAQGPSRHQQRSAACAAGKAERPANDAPGLSRRECINVAIAAAAVVLPSSALAQDPHVAAVPDNVQDLALRAINAYNDHDLPLAFDLYTEVAALDPVNPVWTERRGQVNVDLKRFQAAIDDFDAAEAGYRKTVDAKYVSLGLLSNRALAYEGLYMWTEALRDYNAVVRLGEGSGYSIPYVLNSRGNCHGSLAALAEATSKEAAVAEWRLAQADYDAATRVFQTSRNLPGAIFSASNAALISAQLGDDAKALKELKNVARRAPGSIDMRAAIAAIYYAANDQKTAEEYWGWACSKINSGQLVPGGPVLDSCSKYGDADWLGRVRRWPPVMVDRMGDFLQLTATSSAPARL